jgi:glycosyltransferase involved in cell wall biosynthesis
MKIGHYDSELGSRGGVTSYIRRIGSAQEATGHEVYYFSNRDCGGAIATKHPPIVVPDNQAMYSQAKNLGLDILHVHKGLGQVPPGDLTVIRTLHGHQPYCPSGSKYFKRWNKACDRTYSMPACLWGHLVDGCGSIRPGRIQFNFQYTQDEMRTLAQMPVITVSRFLKEQLVRAGYSEHLIRVLYLFAPSSVNDAPPPQVGVPHFVFLGRIAPEKGIDWLLHSLQKVKVPVHLDIAGEGFQEPAMQQLANKLGIGDRVTFHGWVDAKRVNQLIASARALIFPSTWHEPGGTVAFEAMSNARAVIMSRVGGMVEVVQEEINGLLVEPNDVSAMANCIERLATDWSLATHLGAKGKRIACDQFTLENHLRSLLEIYQQVIRRGG